jgi:uncharacterized membrane protein YccC
MQLSLSHLKPSPSDWLFSVKTFAASMLALYLGLKFELPRPYWAMASVYIVSNPFVGATRSKALYRGLGTLLGAAAAIALVPPFVEAPVLFSFVVAGWTGSLLFLSMFDRTSRAYVFMLAGYTMPLIALPTVMDPTTVFDVGIARSEEILLGIVCASTVGLLLFPSRLAPTLIERTDSWFRDAATYGREMLSANVSGTALSACRQRLASTVNGLELLLGQLSYDHTHPEVLARAQALRGRMQVFLPMMSSLADPLLTLKVDLKAELPEFKALLADTAEWFDAPLKARADEALREVEGESRDEVAEARHARMADFLHARIDGLRPKGEDLSTWQGAVLANALWRLGQVIDVWQDCRSLRTCIEHESANWQPVFRHWRLGGNAHFFDHGMMLFSTLLVVTGILIACNLWIFSGWHDGATAITLASIACCFFASLDRPGPEVFRFFLTNSASVVLAGLYVFFVLPQVHDFAMLATMLAPPFILLGTLIPRPQFTKVVMSVAVSTATFVSIQGVYESNIMVFLNNNIAGIAGLIYALVWTLATRPFGAELAARRLTRSGWAEVALAASKEPIADLRNMTSRMLDRLMLLIPRLAVSDSQKHPSITSIRDLRVALNALDLQHLQKHLPPALSEKADLALLAIHGYYAACANRNRRLAEPQEMMAAIDDALLDAGKTIAAGQAQKTAGKLEEETGLRWVSEASHALVGMRLSLFPALAGQAPRQSKGAAA